MKEMKTKSKNLKRYWYFFRRGDNTYLRFFLLILITVGSVWTDIVLKQGLSWVFVGNFFLFTVCGIIGYTMLSMLLGYFDYHFGIVGTDNSLADEKNKVLMKIQKDLDLIKEKLDIK